MSDAAFRPPVVAFLEKTPSHMSTSELLRVLVHAEIQIATDPVSVNTRMAERFRENVRQLRAELDYRVPKERP